MRPDTRAAVRYSIHFLVRIAAAAVVAVLGLLVLGLDPALAMIGVTLAFCVILARQGR